MINDGLPKQIDEVTRFDKVAYLPGNIYAQYFTLTSSDRAPYNDTATLKPRIAQNILNNIKTNQGFAAFRSYNVTFVYVYRNKTEQPLFTITITPQQYNN
jgi:hypothetical protein